MDSCVRKHSYDFIRFNIGGESDRIKYPAIAEIKYDGELCLADIKNGTCTLYSEPHVGRIRNNCCITKELESMDLKDSILLGELYYGNGKNLAQFLNHRFDENLKLAIFDIVQYHGKSTRSWPLSDRLEILRKHVQRAIHVHTPDSLICYNGDDADAFLEETVFHNYEGIVIKSLCGTLKAEVLKDQAVLINECYAVLPIIGLSKKDYKTSLLIGYSDRGPKYIEPLAQCKTKCNDIENNQLRSVLSRFVSGETEAYYLIDKSVHIMAQIKHGGVLYNFRGEKPYGLRNPEFISFLSNKNLSDMRL